MIFHLNDKNQWQPILRQQRDAKSIIVTTNGTFDIVHVGHIDLLRKAKNEGDFLVVGLNSDRSVQTYKSPLRPLVPQEERAELVSAIRYVDMVLVFDEPESLRFVEEVKPDVHVKDSSYGYDLIERPVVEEHGGRIHLIDKDQHSTTNLIEKILHVYKMET